MFQPKHLYLASIIFGAICSLSLPVIAQYKIELLTCADAKVTLPGSNTPDTATCINPTNTFEPKGTLRNVHLVANFPKVPTGAGITFLITENDANGEHVQYVDYSVSPRHTTAYAALTINKPGKYFVRMANFYNKAQVWATAEFMVTEDKVGPRAAGNTAAGQGKVSVCTEIDDDWKCVGQSATWKADTYFNMLFENPTPVKVDFIGIVIHKQGPNGKDVAFINEYQQNIGEANRKYGTVGNNFRLPAGTYSIYIIAWGKRELLVHNGNLTEYFAKTTLVVK